MIKLIIRISDLHAVSNSDLIISNASYVPQIGEHLSLTSDQAKDIRDRILDSPELKKRLMKYINWFGGKPLKKSEWKDLTPAQIRQKVRNHQNRWFVNLPPTIKLVTKCIYMEEGNVRVIYEGNFSDEYYQTIPESTDVQCAEAIITCIDQINEGLILFNPKKD